MVPPEGWAWSTLGPPNGPHFSIVLRYLLIPALWDLELSLKNCFSSHTKITGFVVTFSSLYIAALCLESKM